MSAAAAGTPGVTPPRVVFSEWIKLRSLRSTWFSLLAAGIAAIGLGVLVSAIRENDFASHPGMIPGPDFDPTAISLRGLYLAQLAFGVLGVLLITGEYSTGMIRASLTAVPRRTPVWAAKAVVYGAAAFVIATAMSLIAFLAGQAAMQGHHLGVSLTADGAARAVIGGGLYLAAVGLLGLGLGFAIRNTGGAIAALFGLLLILPLLAQALPSSWATDVEKYLPLNAGTAVMTTKHDATSLAPWAGLGIFALYMVAALAVGLLVLHRRDA